MWYSRTVNRPDLPKNNVAGFHLGGLESATVALVILTLVLLSINVGIDLYRARKSQEDAAASAGGQDAMNPVIMRSDVDPRRRSCHSNQERAPVFSSKAKHTNNNNNNEGTCVFVTFFAALIVIAFIYRAFGT